jgi:uncharacterized protein YyaL (SSP411 family)
LNYPPISLDFVKALTDNTGILQHAKFGTPRRKDGYTTDDNARALIAVTKYYKAKSNSTNVNRLLDTYLSFLLLMQKNDGKMRNLLSYDQRFIDDEGSEDCMGRTLWSCGCVVESNLSIERRLMAKEIFDRLLPWAFNFNSPRAIAFAVMGLARYQKAFMEDPNPTKNVRMLVGKLLENYRSHRSRRWRWFEPYLTYCNGRLPQALFEAYTVVPDEQYMATAAESFGFLLEVQTINGVFVPIGNRGWYMEGGPRAVYDQQAVEAAVMTEAALSANVVIGRSDYKDAAQTVLNWFFGENTLKVQVYNSDMGGCYDGITPKGLNLNMGAEATVCYLSARIDVELSKNRSTKLALGRLLKRQTTAEKKLA